MRRSFEDLGQKGCFAAGTCVHVSGQAETMPYTQEERQQQARDFLGGFWIHAMEQACSSSGMSTSRGVDEWIGLVSHLSPALSRSRGSSWSYSSSFSPSSCSSPPATVENRGAGHQPIAVMSSLLDRFRPDGRLTSSPVMMAVDAMSTRGPAFFTAKSQSTT